LDAQLIDVQVIPKYKSKLLKKKKKSHSKMILKKVGQINYLQMSKIP